MIAIVDYGAGNLASVKKALDRLGVPSRVVSTPEELEGAHRIILPGVGHFSSTSTLEASGLKAAISGAISRGVPFLGICVGMQWMFESSDEAPDTRGLGLLSGNCRQFSAGVKSPHVGWNSLNLSKASKLFRGISGSPFAYFTHSYRVPVVESTVAECDYGGAFSAVVEHGNAFGVQFHPEKSADLGLTLLENFCHLPC